MTKARVCYPLAFERSGYIHPTFNDFIDLFARCSSYQPQPHTALQLRFAVSFAITFTTAALLRQASYRLQPRSLNAFVPPKPLTVPACWAPSLPPHLTLLEVQRLLLRLSVPGYFSPYLLMLCPHKHLRPIPPLLRSLRS